MGSELSQRDVKELLEYDKEAGLLFWKKRTPKWFTDGKNSAESTCNTWNTKFSGTLALNAVLASGYKKGCILCKQYYAHRIIWLWMTGEWPTKNIDHKDGNPSNNSWNNLRDVEQKINCKNLKMGKNNLSGKTGVHWSQSRNKWVVQIMVDYKNIFCGHYDSFEDACKRRDLEELKHGFYDNHGKALTE